MRWFQQVADGATVTEVSDLEMVSQPGVSRALARVERSVGAPLLYRSGRTLRMTAAGVAFKAHVDALLHQLDDGLAAVQQLVDPETGTVRLAFQPSLGSWLVPDLVRSFRVDHPDIRIQPQSKAEEHAPVVGVGSEIDLELSTWRPPHQGFSWRSLAREPLRLLVPADHRLAGRTPLPLGEAAEEPFVMIRSTSLLREQSVELCRRAGFSPQVAFVVDDLPTIGGYVAAGLGVAIVPAVWESAAVPSSARLRHLELSDKEAWRDVGMAWSTQRRMLPAAALFRDHILRRARAGRLPRPLGSTAPGDNPAHTPATP